MLWIAFGAVHSVLTMASVKQVLHPWLSYRYRLVYNGVSALHIGVVVLWGRQLYRGAEFIALSDWQRNSLTGISLIGIVILLLSLREYDLGLFSGLKQWQLGRAGQSADGVEPLSTQGMHRYVRHPLYTGAFLLLWGGADSMYGLMTAFWASVYLVLGTLFEEKKLLSLYGAAYRDYRNSVPMYIPWKFVRKLTSPSD